MDYKTFKDKVIGFPLIKARDVEKWETSKQSLRNQLRRWQNRQLIIKLKKGIYILNANDRRINPSRQFIANQLYAPSYVSLEYALGYYNLIPEGVFVVSSVTTKKTVEFSNGLGSFSYQHVKPYAFRGFKAVKDQNNLNFFIAEAEKAVTDFFYLNLSRFDAKDENIFEQSYRFQNTEILNLDKIKKYAQLYKNNKLVKIASLFCKFSEEERR